MTEWVTSECGEHYVGQLKPELMLTMRSTLRSADTGDVGKFRAAMREHLLDTEDFLLHARIPTWGKHYLNGH